MKKVRIVMPVLAILFAFVGAFASVLVKPVDQTRVNVSRNNPCQLDGTCIEESGAICQDDAQVDLYRYIGTCPSKIQGRDFEEE